jgi:hypothetical protein
MAKLGLVLIGVVAWATEQLARRRNTPADLLRRSAGYLALAFVRLVGAAVDTLSLPDRTEREAKAVRTSPLSARARPS